MAVDWLRTITAREAEQSLGVPASSLRAWASRSSRDQLRQVGLRENREIEYSLMDVLALIATKQRRTRHTRPNRGGSI